MREDAMMYDCAAHNVTATGQPVVISITGGIEKSIMAPDQQKALMAIKKTKERIES